MTSILKSKTLWVNAIAAIGLFLSSQYGIALSGEQTGMVLAGINAFLRAATIDPLEW